MEVIENPRLSTVVDVITQEVTKSLQKCISQDIIIENQETWKHLSNIPQVKKLINKNIELQTELAVQKKSLGVNNVSDKTNIIEILRNANSKLQKNVVEKNKDLRELEQKIEQQDKIIETQKKWLIKLRTQVKELKNPLKINTNLESNKISLEVEELETKNDIQQAIDDSKSFCDDCDDKEENTVIDNKISINAANEPNLDEISSTESSSEDESQDDELMLEHWEREKRKLDQLQNTYGINEELETKDDSPTNISDKEEVLNIPWRLDSNQTSQDKSVANEDNEEEEEEEDEEEEEEEDDEEVEEITLKINGKKQKVYKSDNGNVYEILLDEEAGDLIGTINNKGKFIPL